MTIWKSATMTIRPSTLGGLWLRLDDPTCASHGGGNLAQITAPASLFSFKVTFPLNSAAHFSASCDDSEFVPPAATRIPTDRLWPPGDRTGARLFQKVFHTDHSPCNKISGGKVLGSATRKTHNRIAEALRLAAFGLEKAKCRMGEFCRRMKGRLGKAEGITATAHKLARVIYALIAHGCSYDEAQAFRANPGVERKQLKTLQILAKKLGFQLIEHQPLATT
jgi:hypothetical protein